MFVSFTTYSFTLQLQPCCPLSSPGAHTLLSINYTPTLHEMGKLTVDHVASQQEAVAPHLAVESCGVCKFGSGHLQEASRGALSRWLKGESDTDIKEKTKCSILEALETCGNVPLADQLKLFEESSGEPVLVLVSRPGKCVVGQNVCILFAISVHCNALNTCQWLFLHFHVCTYSTLSHCLHLSTFTLGRIIEVETIQLAGFGPVSCTLK